MSSTAFNPNPEWHWPEHVHAPSVHPDHLTGASDIPRAFQDNHFAELEHKTAQSAKHWPPRTCRICLETVLPTYHPPSSSLPDILKATPSVTYISTDPETGRLIHPCKCKGSSRYVHEGCLQAWRHADPAYGKRNYWQCPTCGFRYSLERMKWARWVSSKVTQITLTFSILFLAMFLLGFVADPIINLYLDPYTTISSTPLSKIGTKIDPILTDDDEASWAEHFLKGLASLGLLSFIKVLLALSPWQWWNLRSSGIMAGSGRAGGSGRERLASISWIVVLIGVGTFLWVSIVSPRKQQHLSSCQGVYKGVRAWSRRTLEKAGERVVDVPLDDDDPDETIPETGAGSADTPKD
ncbi:MAG: hypothetical protein M1830_008562 [Pleopsidium flavum]|nr:MAG: hypothetical protein M1830_008562 [Pleopsidium flavum]